MFISTRFPFIVIIPIICFLLLPSLASSSDDDDENDDNNNDLTEDPFNDKLELTFSSFREVIASTLSAIRKEEQLAESLFTEQGSVLSSSVSSADREKLTWLAYNKVFGYVVSSLQNSIVSEVVDAISRLKLSSSCVQTLVKSLTALKQQKSWIFKMIDATGRPFSAGLMDGTITDFGSFDQCISIEVPLQVEADGNVREIGGSSKGVKIRGQYCMAQYNVFLPPRPKHLNLQTRIFNFTGTPIEGTFLEEISQLIHVCYERVGRFGICIPSSCSKNDLEQMIDYGLKEMHLNANVSHCEIAKDYEFNGIQLTVLISFGLLALITVIGTLFDMMIFSKVTSSVSPSKRPTTLIPKLKFNGKLASFLISWSIPRNLTNLMDTRTKQGTLDAINGIRVISMSWIVYTHTYLIPIKETFAFARSYIFAVESFLFQFILNGWVLVDTFFCIGALLAIYTSLGSIHRSKRINLVEMIINRFLRFSPSVWFTLGLLFLLPALGTGPLWSEYFNYQLDKCNNYWWGTVLFVNNWFPESKICMLHTWYISADMQLYLVCIVSLVVFYKYEIRALWLPHGLIVASMLAVFLKTYFGSAAPTVIYNSPSEVITDGAALSIYTPTYIHLGPYSVGLIAGFLIYYKRQVVIPKSLCVTCWILSISGLITILFYTYTWNIGNQWTPISAGFYATLHRTCWSICIAWITYACVTGNGGIINVFLSWKGFIPLARLSFMIYLLHFPILWWRYAYLRERLAFGHYTMLCEFIVNFTLSVFAALLAHLLIEAPSAQIYKIFIQKHFNWARIKLEQKQSFKAPNPDRLIAFKA